jgi:transposase, IS5 family
MQQMKKGTQWHLGIRARVEVDTESGHVHSLNPTTANVIDVTRAQAVLHGEGTAVFAVWAARAWPSSPTIKAGP